MDSIFACFYLTGQLKLIPQKFQLAGVVLVVSNPHVFNLTGQLELKPLEFPTLAATALWCPVQIQHHQNWTSSHSQNNKIVQRDAMGPKHKSVYWSRKSHERCSWLNLGLSVPMEAIAGRVWARDCLYQRHTQYHSWRSLTARVWLQSQSNSGKLLWECWLLVARHSALWMEREWAPRLNN